MIIDTRSRIGVVRTALAWRALAYLASQIPESVAGIGEDNRIVFCHLELPLGKIDTLSRSRLGMVTCPARKFESDRRVGGRRIVVRRR
jgi:hypothetical protein